MKYKMSETAKKRMKCQSWVKHGLIHNDIDELYEYYLNVKNCETCQIPLISGRYNRSNTRTMDHNHNTGEFRNVLCQRCNTRLKLNNTSGYIGVCKWYDARGFTLFQFQSFKDGKRYRKCSIYLHKVLVYKFIFNLKCRINKI
tara:strand:- start:245 stop:673 length:429 start_codon:yes stop_codon:yes gene_type:complete